MQIRFKERENRDSGGKHNDDTLYVWQGGFVSTDLRLICSMGSWLVWEAREALGRLQELKCHIGSLRMLPTWQGSYSHNIPLSALPYIYLLYLHKDSRQLCLIGFIIMALIVRIGINYNGIFPPFLFLAINTASVAHLNTSFTSPLLIHHHNRDSPRPWWYLRPPN